MAKTDELTALLSPMIEDLGFELVGIEYRANPKHSLLRVYIDLPEGEILVANCVHVSREISALLEVRDPIRGHYDLEVSSPGLDRPLFSLAHFVRFVGEEVRISVALPVNGRRRFKATIKAVAEDGRIVVVQDGSDVELDHGNIVKARLVPQF